MKKSILTLLFFGCTLLFLQAQNTPSIAKVLEKYQVQNIACVTLSEAFSLQEQAIFIDTRSKKEFKVSHIKDAFFMDYDRFSSIKFQSKFPNKNRLIILYCSLGVRSGKITEKLQQIGYTNVYNLYGGIFNWHNKTYPIYTTDKQKTTRIAGFSKSWSKYITRGIIVL